MVDFYHAGILTVLVFYFFKQKNWLSYAGQLIFLWYINTEMLGGFTYEFHLGGQTYFFARQGFALLALIPIWLYHGIQGYYSKALQYTYEKMLTSIKEKRSELNVKILNLLDIHKETVEMSLKSVYIFLIQNPSANPTIM